MIKQTRDPAASASRKQAGPPKFSKADFGGEQKVIQKLEAQKNAVKPSQQLLSRIIAQLSVEEQPQSFGPFYKETSVFTWVRFALPVVAVVLVAAVFVGTRFAGQTPLPVPAQNSGQQGIAQFETPVIEQPLSIAAIQTEQAQIDQGPIYEDFFADEKQMQEIETTLAGF